LKLYEDKDNDVMKKDDNAIDEEEEEPEKIIQ
jgi:hypothetical protein